MRAALALAAARRGAHLDGAAAGGGMPLVLAALGPRTSEEAREQRARARALLRDWADDRLLPAWLGGRGRGWFVDDQGRDLLHGEDPQARS